MSGTRASGRGFLCRLAAGAVLAVALLGGCATGPDPARIGSDGAASLRRAADNIEQALAARDRVAEHWNRALTLVEKAWPELQAEVRELAAATDGRRDEALLRTVAGRLRAIADGSQEPPPRAPLLEIAGVFRDVAASFRQRAHDAATHLERIRERENISEAEGDGAAGDSAVDELAQAVDAMTAAADHYDTAADEIEQAAAEAGE